MVLQQLEFRHDARGQRIAKKALHAEGTGNFVLNQRLAFYSGNLI